MRSYVLVAIAVFAVAVAEGMDIGRPKLHNKLSHARAKLSGSHAVGSVSRAEIEQLEHLRVAAAEREESLADRFAMDLAAHVQTADAAAVKVEAETVVTSSAAEGESVEADLATEDEGESEAESESEADAEESSSADSGLSIESLQELEFSKSSLYAPRKDALKAGVKPVTLQTGGMRWSNCMVAGKKGKGSAQSSLSSVVLRAAPPLRDQSLIVEIDGKYTGPDVTYGSATLQIARVSSPEPQAKDLPDLVYRHSIVLKDVLMANPFTSKDALSATMYVPESVFNMYAPSGVYTATITFTNQDKQPFACAKVDFDLA